MTDTEILDWLEEYADTIEMKNFGPSWIASTFYRPTETIREFVRSEAKRQGT